MVGLVALSTGAYGESGRVILFAITLLVIALIVATILRWIEHLSRFGRVGDTTERVEQVTTRALSERIANPCLGAHCWDGAVPPGCRPLYPADSFYLQHLDVLTLSELAEEHQLALYVPVQPGAFVHPAEPLLWVYGQLDEDLQCTLCDCFTLDRCAPLIRTRGLAARCCRRLPHGRCRRRSMIRVRQSISWGGACACSLPGRRGRQRRRRRCPVRGCG
ncbi:DUF2254 family protein [Halopseudomonas pachastrellae]|nr:DUF2254 family protein [Halopseudomonas pachastrellae]